jgi:very-short-patch-repair endonuclease
VKTDKISGTPMLFVPANGDLWFSHGALARLLQTTTQNIVMHLRDLRLTDSAPIESLLPTERVEGTRVVRRRTKHVNLSTAATVALRARRFSEYDSLLKLGRNHGLPVSEVRISAMKERDFGQLLEGVLAGIAPVHRQFRVGSYRIDFFLPSLGLAVEYDELHHSTPLRTDADVRRQAEIVRQHGFQFLRVRQGAEIEGLNEIVKRLFALQTV